MSRRIRIYVHMDSLKTDYFKWMDAPVKACIIGITAALGSFVAATDAG